MFILRPRVLLTLFVCLVVQIGIMPAVRAMADPVMTSCAMIAMPEASTTAIAPAMPTQRNHVPLCCSPAGLPGWIAPAKVVPAPPTLRGITLWHATIRRIVTTQDNLPLLRPPRDLRA